MEDKVAAAMAYIITGSSEQAAKLCGVSGRTIRHWTTQEWWPDLIADARRTKQEELDTQLTDIIHKAIGGIKARVENGDEHTYKDGSKIFKPVPARDLAWITAILIDKRAIMRGSASVVAKNVPEKERLAQLKKDFEKITDVKVDTKKEPILDTELDSEKEVKENDSPMVH